MRNTISELRNILEQKKGQKAQTEQNIIREKQALIFAKRELKRNEHALDIVNFVAQETQEHLSFHVGNIVSLALEGVFSNPYALQLEFEIKRGKTEAQIYFVRDGEKIDPISAAGGGVVDIASFALRIAAWSMQMPRTRNTIILDEPFKHLSAELRPAAAEMLEKLSKKLKLQIIMITHSEELIPENATVFKVRNRKGISEVCTA